MRPAKSAMSRHRSEATKALLFKGKTVTALDSPMARGRQIGRGSPEPDSQCRSGHVAAVCVALNAPICRPKGSAGAVALGALG